MLTNLIIKFFHNSKSPSYLFFRFYIPIVFILFSLSVYCGFLLQISTEKKVLIFMTTQDSVDYHAELFNRVSFFPFLVFVVYFISFSFRIGVGETRKSNLNKFL